jgi:hypothetical protein
LKWEIPAEVCELDLKNGERSRRRVRDLVTQLAFEGRSQNETERARISMMARSDLLHARAGYRSARPTTAILKIQLATRGRSIQLGQKTALHASASHVRSTPCKRTFDAQIDICAKGHKKTCIVRASYANADQSGLSGCTFFSSDPFRGHWFGAAGPC